MENILQSLENVTFEIGKFKVLVSKVLSEISEKKTELDLVEISQAQRSKELNGKEIELKKISDIAGLKEEGLKLLSQAEEKTKDLSRAQENFNAFVASERKIISEQKTKNQEERLNNERNSDALIKAKEELEIEKKNYKEKILSEIKLKVS